MYKYLFIWQIGGEKADETGGMFFPCAIQHVFVGLYLQQISLGTLFFLSQNAEGEQSAVAKGVLMIVLVVFTVSHFDVTSFSASAHICAQAFFHITINNSYGPLEHYLPLTLAGAMHRMAASADPTSAPAALPPQEPDDSASYVEHIMRQRITAAEENVVSTAKMEGPQITALGVDEEMGPEDCYHPASVDPEPIIWIPRDPLGLAEAEERSMRAAGIEASSQNAVVDAEGHVDVTGPPPRPVPRHLDAA